MSGTYKLDIKEAREAWSSNPACYSPERRHSGTQYLQNQTVQAVARRNLTQSQIAPPPSSPTGIRSIASTSPTFDYSERETVLIQEIERLFNNKSPRSQISALLSELYWPISLKNIGTALDLHSDFTTTLRTLEQSNRSYHDPLTRALRRGCSQQTVQTLYRSQVSFTDQLLSLVIIKDEGLCIFHDVLSKYIQSGQSLRYQFVEQACEHKRPLGILKTLIESFQNPTDEQVCAFFSATLYYKYYETFPEILPYLISKFAKTHESSVLDILIDLTDDFEFAHALPQLPSMAVSFINAGGTWTSEIIESALSNRSIEKARPLVSAMIDSQKPISEDDVEIVLHLCDSKESQTALFSAFLEKGGKVSSSLLKTSLSSPHASSEVVELIVLEIVKEQGCLSEEQVNLPIDFYSKTKKDLLRMHGPVGSIISL